MKKKDSIHELVEKLLDYGVEKGMLCAVDLLAARNQICRLLDITPDMELFSTMLETVLETHAPIMEKILDWCVAQEQIQDSAFAREQMEAELMSILMPRQSEVLADFYEKYHESPEAATDWFYQLCRSCGYIQVDRLSRNLYWKSETNYGHVEITVNLSKPEKDPRDIAAAAGLPQTGYPQCLLCVENVGYAGRPDHPARQNLRVISMELDEEDWYFQYSPYIYYNEHCIVLNRHHVPMRIHEKTFRRLFDFLRMMPHYFIGSNADLPVVGGSILSHDHFQGGRHVFPMEKAASIRYFSHKNYGDVSASWIHWPMSVIRLKGSEPEIMVGLAVHVLNCWREWSDSEADILAWTENKKERTPHNTITPIARMNQQGQFELDLVLRNNRTSEEHPLGIFHPHANLHHIKKENIGLIEVMGLAVLPGRLAEQLERIQQVLCGEHVEIDPAHESWVSQLVAGYGQKNSMDTAERIVQNELGAVFIQVLRDAGVFKFEGNENPAFYRFMEAAGFQEYPAMDL